MTAEEYVVNKLQALEEELESSNEHIKKLKDMLLERERDLLFITSHMRVVENDVNSYFDIDIWQKDDEVAFNKILKIKREWGE